MENYNFDLVAVQEARWVEGETDHGVFEILVLTFARKG
jgi:hypothetical protein